MFGMAGRRGGTTAPPEDFEENIVDIDVAEEMRGSYLEYAYSVIYSRALPDARDGLKPVQRRILYQMNEMGLRPDRAHVKCARVVGEVMGRLHPHGDSAIYDALVRMAQPWAMRLPLVDGHGNFGSLGNDDPPAAMRYTEARLTPASLLMTADIDEDTVDFSPNYDGQEQEPVALPAAFPNLLVNGSSGIAVGMATNIPPHNLAEIIDATVHLIDNPQATPDDLMQFVKGPDFPTGALILGKSGIHDAYRTGRGSIKMRAVAEIEEARQGMRVVVTEVPYQTSVEVIGQKIAELVNERRIEGIRDVRNESSGDTVRLVVELKRDANAQVVLNQLYKHTPMQSSFAANMVSLVDGVPRLLNLLQALQVYVAHQVEVVTRRTEFRLKKARGRAHIVEGLLRALDQIDAVIALIRGSESADAAKQAFMVAPFEFSEEQATHILDMQLRRLAALERQKIIEEHEETLKLIEELKSILASDVKLMGIIKTELQAVKDEYGDGRRTEILTETTELTVEDLLADEEMVVTITRSGYIKRTHVEAYRSQRRGGKGVTGMETKEEDIVEDLFVASTHAYLLFFTNLGKVHWLKVHEIPEGGRQAKGKAMVNLLSLGENEHVATCVPVRDFAAGGYVFFVTRQGKVKKTDLDAYSHPRAGGIQAIGLEDGDEVIAVRRTDGQREVMIATKAGMAIRFAEDEVRPMGRGAAGVRGIDVEEGDEVIAADVVVEGATILTVSERGFGKRTPLEEYRLQGRAGKGIIDIKTGGRNGNVVGMLQVRDGDDLLVVTTKGKLIRIHSGDVSSQGRNTMGVRIIDLEADDKVGSIARVEAEQPAPEAQ